jgi:hypothetical protein
MSLGSTYRGEIIEDALDDAAQHGVIVTGAAGNLGTTQREHPAGFNDAFGVAATDQSDIRADFSSHYDEVKLSAPGVEIIGTIPLNDEGHRYAEWEGTSFSTAITAGAAALVVGANPEWPESEARVQLVFSALQETAAALPGDPEGMGEGRLNAGAAVTADPAAAAASDFTVTSGVLLEGDLTSLRDREDGDYLVINSQFGFCATEPYIVDLRVGFVTFGEPQTIEIELTSRMNSSGGTGRVFLRNWKAKTYDLIGTYAVPLNDLRIDFEDIDASDYLRPSDGRLEVRITHSLLAAPTAAGFKSFFDELSVEFDD